MPLKKPTGLTSFETLSLSVFALAAAHSGWALSVGWFNSILDLHGFRQSHTAIVALFLQRGGPWLAYETPVLGPPWSIPLELPLYQGITAFFSTLLDTHLDQTGRAVSATFYYLCLVPIWHILASLQVARAHRWTFLSLFLVSPLYLFWSRTFLIESTALFLSLSFLALVLAFIDRPRIHLLVSGSILGAAAGMVKVTTLAAFWGMAVAIVGLALWQARSPGSPRSPALGKLGVALPAVVGFVLIPVIATALWTNFADNLKLLNPLAGNLTAAAAREWNFGWFGQRTSSELWRDTIWNRVAPDLLGTRLMILAPLALLPLAGRRRREVVGSLILFLAVMLVFTNLHIRHNYYQYANGLFALAAVGFTILGLLEQGGTRRAVGIGLLTLSIGCSIVGYQRRFLPYADTDRAGPSDVAAAVRSTTGPDDVILVYGRDWSSEIPYLSRRRALMVPNWVSAGDPRLLAALENLSHYPLGAVVVCDPERARQQGWKEHVEGSESGLERIFVGQQCQVFAHPHTG